MARRKVSILEVKLGGMHHSARHVGFYFFSKEEDDVREKLFKRTTTLSGVD